MKLVELFKLVEDAEVWNLTSADTEQTFSAETYTPTVVGRTESEQKSELSRANVELTFGIDNPIPRRWLGAVIDKVVSLTIWTKQDATFIVAWKGRLTAVKPENEKIRLIFESVFTSLRRPGLRARYQRNCRHTLYSPGCNLDKEDFAIAGTATAAAGYVVTVTQAASYPDTTFRGGILKSPDGTLRFIMEHVGTQITLIREIASLDTFPASVTLYPGCDRTREICLNRFNNIDNNGSFPFITTRNPFSGNSFV